MTVMRSVGLGLRQQLNSTVKNPKQRNLLIPKTPGRFETARLLRHWVQGHKYSVRNTASDFPSALGLRGLQKRHWDPLGTGASPGSQLRTRQARLHRKRPRCGVFSRPRAYGGQPQLAQQPRGKAGRPAASATRTPRPGAPRPHRRLRRRTTPGSHRKCPWPPRMRPVAAVARATGASPGRWGW